MKIMISFGLFLLTVAYCWLIWIGFGFYSIILPTDIGGNFSLITWITAFHDLPFPYHAAPWQILAVVSLVINIVWCLQRGKSSGDAQMFTLPVSCHIGWILFSLCCHGIGMLSPYVTIAAVLTN